MHLADHSGCGKSLHEIFKNWATHQQMYDQNWHLVHPVDAVKLTEILVQFNLVQCISVAFLYARFKCFCLNNLIYFFEIFYKQL